MKTIDTEESVNIDFDKEEQELVELSMNDITMEDQTYFDSEDNGNQPS